MNIYLKEEDKKIVIGHLEKLIREATNYHDTSSLDQWFSLNHKLTCIDDPNHVVSTDPQVATLVDTLHILQGRSTPLKPEYLLPHNE